MFDINGKFILMALFLAILAPTTTYAQWEETNGPGKISVPTLAAIGPEVFAGTFDGGIYRTTDNGDTWVLVDSPGSPIVYLTSIGTSIIATSYYGTIRSTDSGASWISWGGEIGPIWGNLVEIGTLLFGGGPGVVLSTDDGISWNYLEYTSAVGALATRGTTLYVVSTGGYVAMSIDSGMTWDSTGICPVYPQTFLCSGSNLIVGSQNGVYLSTNNGGNWTSTGATGFTVTALLKYDTLLFAATRTDAGAGASGGVWCSKDNGSSWATINEGLTDSTDWALAENDSFVFVGTISTGIWRRPLSELIPPQNSVNENVTSIIPSIAAYPNPSSGRTTIQYSVSGSSSVKISIMNLLGEEVAEIFDGELNAGVHSFIWNSGNYPAGTYFCVVQSGLGEISRAPIAISR